MNGLFLVIDGIDGAGKTSAIKEVKAMLVKSGVSSKKIVLTAEPTNSPFGLKVREMLSSKAHVTRGGDFLSLYVLDRKHHLKSEILPAVSQGKIVLCDRYKYSTLVYQSIQGISEKKIIKMHEGMLKPSITFILDVPCEKAISRLSSSGRKKLELFEKKNFLEKARKKFRILEKFFPGEKILVIDASRPILEIAEEIFLQIKKLV